MPCFFCPRKSIRLFPIESCVKLLGLSIHLLMEMYTVETDFLYRGKKYLPMPAETLHHLCTYLVQ
jgi:hypothetical protein